MSRAYRREFSRSDKGEMLRRASDEKGRIHCEGCGCDITGKKIEFDHVIAEGLIVDKAKKLTPADGQVLGECCHRGPDGKTAQDVEAIARAKRMEAAHYGLRAPSSLKGARFRKAPPQRRATAPLTKTCVDRRTGQEI